MENLESLKAVILITEFGTDVVVSELSENNMFINDLRQYHGNVDDIFCGIEKPKEKGFYEFNGGANISTDIGGAIDDVDYYGDFTKLNDFKFKG